MKPTIATKINHVGKCSQRNAVPNASGVWAFIIANSLKARHAVPNVMKKNHSRSRFSRFCHQINK